jgi:hypothetical protein
MTFIPMHIARKVARLLCDDQPTVRGRSCLGYAVKAHDVDLMRPIVVLKIDHTRQEVHIGATE